MRRAVAWMLGGALAKLSISGCAMGVMPNDEPWADDAGLGGSSLGGNGPGGSAAGGAGLGTAAPGGSSQAGGGQGAEGLGSTATGGSGQGAAAPGGSGAGGYGAGGGGGGGAQGGSGQGGSGPLSPVQLCADACIFLTMCGSINPGCQSSCEFDLLGCTASELDQFDNCYQVYAPNCYEVVDWQLCLTAIACVD